MAAGSASQFTLATLTVQIPTKVVLYAIQSASPVTTVLPACAGSTAKTAGLTRALFAERKDQSKQLQKSLMVALQGFLLDALLTRKRMPGSVTHRARKDSVELVQSAGSLAVGRITHRYVRTY